MKNRFGLLLFILIGLGALVYSFLPSPVLVETVTVERKSLEVTVQEEGKTRVIDRFVVSAPLAGVAHRIDLKIGDPVAQGAVLLHLSPQRPAVLDPRSRAETEARVAGARAERNAARETVRAAEAEDRLARTALERLQALVAEGLSTQAALDEATTRAQRSRSALRSAQFSVKVAQHRLEEAQTALRFFDEESGGDQSERVPIHAPVAGRVLNVFHESAGVVQAGQALIEIGDPARLEVEAEVLSSDAVAIQAGMKVVFERWGGPEDLLGRVRVVEPAGFTKISALGVEEQRVRVLSDISSPKAAWARLGDGFRVEVRFILWAGENVLQVPRNALFRHEEGWAVFGVEAGKARRKTVQIGRQNGLFAEILSGLTEGERVIGHPSDAVADGVAIEIH